MKLLATFLVLIISHTLFAQDYEIVRFEASDYRTFATDELKELIGDARDLLPKHQCNGKDEYDPLHPPLRMNPLRNSLKVQAADGSKLTYLLGRFYSADGEVVYSLTDRFQQKVASAFERFEKIEPTRKLLRFLEESYFPLTLVAGGNRFIPELEGGMLGRGIQMAQAIAFFTSLRMSDGLPFSDIGVGGKVFWGPKLVISTIEEDGVSRRLDPDVALAHEMYHAFDSIRGMLDMGNIHGKDYELISILEYRAVYFENQVRRQLGIKLRKYYGDSVSSEAPDMLDAQGEPILIPAPCLGSETNSSNTVNIQPISQEVTLGVIDREDGMNIDPQPNPNPVPNPNAPIEVDTGGLHSRPEVDYGSIPAQPPLEPNPEVPPNPDNPPNPSPEPG